MDFLLRHVKSNYYKISAVGDFKSHKVSWKWRPHLGQGKW